MKLALGLVMSVGAALPLAIGCGGDDGGGDVDVPPLFEPQPECDGAEVVAYQGDHQNLISFIEIGDLEDGFDLDSDGDPDNKLAAVGSLAREPIEDAVAQYDLMIPIEFFDVPTVADDACVKFAIYLGVYKTDADTDGEDTAVDGGDCDDTRIASLPGAAEVVDNLLDDNCNGLADETFDAENNPVPSTNTTDNDGDGVSPAAGDCDDSTETGATVTPGTDEICGDGLDNDCDGVADRGGASSTEKCNPYDESPNEVTLDPLSFTDGGDPVIAFTNGTIEGGVLTAGPSIFSVNVPVIDDLTLDLRITGAQIVADIVMDGDSIRLENGKLGGVIDAQTADKIRGLEVEDIGLTPENSLLDAVFANVLGPLLALPTLPPESGHPQCRTPDIDVDLDGLEAFCDSNPMDDIKTVDMCIDGDGTVIMDTATTQCTEATEEDDGRPRFMDGISVELNFATTPTLIVE